MIRRASWVPQVAMLWQFGDTALHRAAMGGTRNHDLIVKKLISEGAEVNAKMIGGITPLHHAARHGNAAALVQLSNARANPNATAIGRSTPLHWAAGNDPQNISCCSVLLDAKANPNKRANFGCTPLQELAPVVKTWPPQPPEPKSKESLLVFILLYFHDDLDSNTRRLGSSATAWVTQKCKASIVSSSFWRRANRLELIGTNVKHVPTESSNISSPPVFGQTPAEVAVEQGNVRIAGMLDAVVTRHSLFTQTVQQLSKVNSIDKRVLEHAAVLNGDGTVATWNLAFQKIRCLPEAICHLHFTGGMIRVRVRVRVKIWVRT